ncbi:MAG: hypothetical protein HFJ51_03295 [Clostridia bacterium]|nr:hypothetical protein [Clostridia bacterium]
MWHGIVLEKKIGDKVSKGEILAFIHTNNREVISISEEKLKEAYEISESEPETYKEILGII